MCTMRSYLSQESAWTFCLWCDEIDTCESRWFIIARWVADCSNNVWNKQRKVTHTVFIVLISLLFLYFYTVHFLRSYFFIYFFTKPMLSSSTFFISIVFNHFYSEKKFKTYIFSREEWNLLRQLLPAKHIFFLILKLKACLSKFSIKVWCCQLNIKHWMNVCLCNTLINNKF